MGTHARPAAYLALTVGPLNLTALLAKIVTTITMACSANTAVLTANTVELKTWIAVLALGVKIIGQGTSARPAACPVSMGRLQTAHAQHVFVKGIG